MESAPTQSVPALTVTHQFLDTPCHGLPHAVVRSTRYSTRDAPRSSRKACRDAEGHQAGEAGSSPARQRGLRTDSIAQHQTAAQGSRLPARFLSNQTPHRGRRNEVPEPLDVASALDDKQHPRSRLEPGGFAAPPHPSVSGQPVHGGGPRVPSSTASISSVNAAMRFRAPSRFLTRAADPGTIRVGVGQNCLVLLADGRHQ